MIELDNAFVIFGLRRTHLPHLKTTVISHVIVFFSGMKISRPYTVVLPSLQISATEREYDGRRFYLMIKIYPDGTLTPTLTSIVAGQLIYRPKVLNCLRQGLSEICEVIHLHSADLIALESVGWIFS